MIVSSQYLTLSFLLSVLMEKSKDMCVHLSPIRPAAPKQQARTKFRAHLITLGTALFPCPATLFRPTQSVAQPCLCGCAAALARSQWREAQSHSLYSSGLPTTKVGSRQAPAPTIYLASIAAVGSRVALSATDTTFNLLPNFYFTCAI